MKAHIIENNTVVNTIEVDDLSFLPNLVEATEGSIGWSYIDGVFSPPPDDVSDEEKSERIRLTRDRKLAQSDWTQVADAPVDQAAWATYRQALRDIPSQAGFPNEVVWPIEP